MLRLYSSGGSQSVEVLGTPLSDERWGILLRSAKRLLKDSGEIEALNSLDKIPFDLCDGTNDFGDDFELLHALVPTAEYLSLEENCELCAPVYRAIADAFQKLNRGLRFIAVDIDTNENIQPVSSPSLSQTSETLEHALSDAETLIRSQGATSGLDRVHTAFHAYLILACKEFNINFQHDSNASALFGLLRQHHPNLNRTTDSSSIINDVLRGLSRVVEALTPARNRGSLAHPNDNLIAEPEAMLLINSIRTLLHYLEQKLR